VLLPLLEEVLRDETEAVDGVLVLLELRAFREEGVEVKEVRVDEGVDEGVDDEEAGVRGDAEEEVEERESRLLLARVVEPVLAGFVAAAEAVVASFSCLA
jgi:hypothetical protein